MYEYRKIEICDEGLLINNDYYKFIKNFTKPDKGNMTEKEYNFLLKVLERKSIKNNLETKLVRWNRIESFTKNKKNITIKINRCEMQIEPIYFDEFYLVTMLEKHCFNKGKVSYKKDFYLHKIFLYIIYLLILIACLYMVKEMF